MKRLFDLTVSILLLLITLPFLAVITVMVKVKIGSPIVFKQQRPGLHGKAFYLYKFRTMSNERNQHGKLLPDSQRLTTIGRFLRKYSLDELLQLINVLKGEISLVGPRPLLMNYLPLYTREQAKRHSVKPGITGWAQINGRNAISWEEKFELDVWYAENQSLFLDIKILMLTLLKVIRSENINQTGSATTESFKGSVSKVSEEHQ